MSSDLKKIYIRLSTLNDSLLPDASNRNATIRDNSWNIFNTSLQELSQLTSDNHYLALKITPINHGSQPFVLVSDYSSKVYQAVNYLYEMERETGLSDAYAPQKPRVGDGNGVSQTSILTQAQDNAQSQVTEVNVEFNQTLTYMTEVIVEAKAKYPEGSKERTFLDKLKSGISTAKTTADLIKMIMTLAVQLGITTEILGQIFK